MKCKIKLKRRGFTTDIHKGGLRVEKTFLLPQDSCKEPKLKEFQFKFIHQIIVIKENFFVMVSNQMMTVSIVAKRTSLTILLASEF